VIYLLELSLQGPGGFDKVLATLQHGGFKVGFALVVWSLLHHLLSGIRFLLIDIGQGVTLQQARRSAWLVNMLAPVMTLACVWWLL